MRILYIIHNVTKSVAVRLIVVGIVVVAGFFVIKLWPL